MGVDIAGCGHHHERIVARHIDWLHWGDRNLSPGSIEHEMAADGIDDYTRILKPHSLAGRSVHDHRIV